MVIRLIWSSYIVYTYWSIHIYLYNALCPIINKLKDVKVKNYFKLIQGDENDKVKEKDESLTIHLSLKKNGTKSLGWWEKPCTVDGHFLLRLFLWYAGCFFCLKEILPHINSFYPCILSHIILTVLPGYPFPVFTWPQTTQSSRIFEVSFALR